MSLCLCNKPPFIQALRVIKGSNSNLSAQLDSFFPVSVNLCHIIVTTLQNSKKTKRKLMCLLTQGISVCIKSKFLIQNSARIHPLQDGGSNNYNFFCLNYVYSEVRLVTPVTNVIKTWAVLLDPHPADDSHLQSHHHT